jgi:hypothetical protein
LSVGYEHNYKPGDILQWYRKKQDGTMDITYWLIYLQDLTELAYFKGDIRKCNYWVNWEDDLGGIHSTWFAVRGPVETRINSVQKNGVSLDTPNYSLNILMPKNEETVNYFKRYAKFYLRGVDTITDTICWRVETTDTISMPGVLELTAVEYYSNLAEDNVEEGLVGDLVMAPLPEFGEELIIGSATMKPKRTYVYKYTGSE